MRRGRFVCSVLIAFALVGAACGGGDDETPSGSAAGSGSYSVGMALPGPKNDKGFNQSHYDGLNAAAEKYGFTANVVENVVDPQARIDAMKNLAADNDLVIGVGGEYAEPGLTAAPQFPDVQFAVINGEVDPDIPNLHATSSGRACRRTSAAWSPPSSPRRTRSAIWAESRSRPPRSPTTGSRAE